MTETVFKTTKSSIEVFRQMIDEANGEHKKTLKTISDSYKGDMFIKMRDRENSEHKARLDDLRKVAYRDICEEIGKVREQISLKAQKRDFKALNELSSLSGLHLSQAEFNLLYEQYSNNNYWNTANVKHFFTLLGKMFFTPYGKEFFTYPGKQIFTS